MCCADGVSLTQSHSEPMVLHKYLQYIGHKRFRKVEIKPQSGSITKVTWATNVVIVRFESPLTNRIISGGIYSEKTCAKFYETSFMNQN